MNPRRSSRSEGTFYFGDLDATADDPYRDLVEVACNRCHGCLARRKRDWAIRCVCELEDHTRKFEGVEISDASFVTLTYDEEHLPEDGCVRASEFSRFMQDLRNSRRGSRLRYLAAGEYGARGRPHYHGILFGVSFHDDRIRTRNDPDVAFQSEELEAIWGKGRTELGPVNFATAAYVAGYVAKKGYDDALTVRPHDREAFTYVFDQTHNSVREVAPEFNSMSRRPGIAHDWIVRNLERVYTFDEVRIGGNSFRPPEFFDRMLNRYRPEVFADIQRGRRGFAERKGLTTQSQLVARKAIFETSLTQRKQVIE